MVCGTFVIPYIYPHIEFTFVWNESWTEADLNVFGKCVWCEKSKLLLNVLVSSEVFKLTRTVCLELYHPDCPCCNFYDAFTFWKGFFWVAFPYLNLRSKVQGCCLLHRLQSSSRQICCLKIKLTRLNTGLLLCCCDRFKTFLFSQIDSPSGQ